MTIILLYWERIRKMSNISGAFQIEMGEKSLN